MIEHRTFSTRHLLNAIGDRAFKRLEEMCLEAEYFFEKQVGNAAVITITETSDQYASTVTGWY